MRRRVTGIILAGGRSDRFGAEKAFALWNGRPFLACVADAVRGVSDGLLVLVPPGAPLIDYARLVHGASIVPDRLAHAGPVEALRGAMELVRSETVLVAPCDAPGLPAGLARRLVAICEESRHATVAEPASGPLFALFAISLVELRERLLGAKRLEDLVRDAERVPTDAEGLNVNEPLKPT